MNFFSKALTIVRNPNIFRRLVSFYWDGYLLETGWFESYRKLRPVNGKNEPIPWVTYAFIDFIESRLHSQLTMLEYGSGYSTLYYSKRLKHVHAVEHDEPWFREMSGQMPPNVSLSHVALDTNGKYASFAKNSATKFDVIVVDGRDRVNCIKESIDSLSPAGVMVLDDSERDEYKEGIAFLRMKNFRSIEFWGIAPGIFFRKCTTVFYRDGNCLGI
jgi:protein-L-isoaspartate O-methyltransferase